jgi:hypothetical protein
VDVALYTEGAKKLSEEKMTFEEYDGMEEYRRINISELVMGEGGKTFPIDLFPFLMIDNDKLYFYKATKAKGYEYYSISDNSTALVQTKRKFNHSLFKIGTKGDKQALFWTEVPPSVNELNGIKANIPTEGITDFVGRKKQIRRIMEEVVEIPNQNGIVYGPGGVGKTALMLELSKGLFEEQNTNNILFENIIWVSAKTNYYNPYLNIVEQKAKQFESLDNIFSVILSFFDYETVEEYGHEDKRELVLELL